MAARPRKPGSLDLPEHLYHYPDGRYMYKRPDGSRVSLGKNRAQAVRVAKKANAEMYPQSAHDSRLLRRVLMLEEQVTVAEAVERYQAEYLPEKELAAATLSEVRRMLGNVVAELGGLAVRDVSVMAVARVLDRLPPNTSNKHRSALMQFYRWAIAKGLADINPAEATLKKREKVMRQRLGLDEYRAIWEAVELWMRNAMDLGLQTLQRRDDIAHMRFDHIRDGRLLVSQRKVARHGTGYLAIRITPPIQAIVDRCRDETVSPYLVHRVPQRKVRQGKDHWTQVKPDMISRAFQEARDRLGLCDRLPVEQRPSFHEIRALGAKLYKDAGIDPQALLGHTSKQMTLRYLDGHEYLEVEAGLVLRG